MSKICPKCQNDMIEVGDIKPPKDHFDNTTILERLTDVLKVWTCKKCGFCELYIPESLTTDNDIQNAIDDNPENS